MEIDLKYPLSLNIFMQIFTNLTFDWFDIDNQTSDDIFVKLSKFLVKHLVFDRKLN